MANTFAEARGNGGYHDYSGLPTLRLSNADIAKFTMQGSGQFAPGASANAANFAGGTLEQTNVLEVWRQWKGVVTQYDRDLLGIQMGMLLEAANHNAAEVMSEFCEVTTERFIHNDETATITMEELEQGGIPRAQKTPIYGSNQGFALRRFGVGLQWNEEYWRLQDMRTLAATMQGILTADANLILSRQRKAFFNATSVDFYDKLQDFALLPTKALLNATGGTDGYVIPPAPYNGATFSSANHTHLMAPGTGNGDTITDAANTAWATSSSANKQTNMNAFIGNMREHENNKSVNVFVNWQDAATYWSVTGTASTGVLGFQHLERVSIVPGSNRDHAVGPSYNSVDQYDGLIGYFDDVPIYRKPWVPVGYMMANIAGGPKPLVARVHKVSAPGTTTSGAMSMGAGDLRLVFATSNWPLHAEAMVRDFDVSVNTRWSAAAFKITATSYAAPTGL